MGSHIEGDKRMTAIAMHASLLAASENPYLDGLGVQPRFVWSFRKMISYSSKALRVRRSSDNAEMDIGFDGDDLDVSSLNAFVGSDDGYLSIFYDQTSNGVNGLSTGNGQQPKIISSGVLLDGAVFDGFNDNLFVTSLPLSQAQVGAYLKIKQDATSTRIVMEMTGNFNLNARTFAFYVENSTYAMGMNNASSATQKINYQALDMSSGLTQVSLIYSRAATGDMETRAYQSGTLVGVTNVPPYTNEQDGTFVPNDFYIGARATSSLFMNGTIETLIIYDGSTTAVRDQIESIVA